jgi:nucleoside-diphosphate-sugar epimerase
MKKIIAITGATGFIGTKLALAHLAVGDKVKILSRRNRVDIALPDSVQCIQGDLQDLAALASFVSDVDVLYHCAGEIRDEAKMHALHVDGTANLIAAARGKIGRWVQLSSVGTYGAQRDGVITERTELNPRGIYEITKLASDQLVIEASLENAFEQVILRPSNVYGATMSNQSLFSLIGMVKRGWFFYLGKAGASANYIHVDNVVKALQLCGLSANAKNQIYNLSDYRTLEQFINLIAVGLNVPAPTWRLPEWLLRLPARWMSKLSKFPLTEARVDALTTRSIYATEKIERELGYRHLVSMEAGLVELVEAYKANQNDKK